MLFTAVCELGDPAASFQSCLLQETVSLSLFLCFSRSLAPGQNSCFAPEALWVCVAVAMPPVTPAVLLPDVAVGSHDKNIVFRLYVI